MKRRMEIGRGGAAMMKIQETNTEREEKKEE